MSTEKKFITVNCANCRHWKKQPPHGNWADEVVESGLCGKIHEDSREEGLLAGTFNHWGDDSGLETDGKFACIYGESA